MARKHLAAIGLGVALLASPRVHTPPARQQERGPDSLELFKRETDPVRKAKLLPHLGEQQLDEIERLTDTGDFVNSGKLLEEYRDEVKNTFKDLKATGVDPEKKPNGFKELQIHLRRALKEIDDVIRKVPEGPRVPFQVARQDVVQVNKELIDLLFPTHPDKPPKKHQE
jgi:hypothetical protein